MRRLPFSNALSLNRILPMSPMPSERSLKTRKALFGYLSPTRSPGGSTKTWTRSSSISSLPPLTKWPNSVR